MDPSEPGVKCGTSNMICHMCCLRVTAHALSSDNVGHVRCGTTGRHCDIDVEFAVAFATSVALVTSVCFVFSVVGVNGS